jgi:hypothetical protein
MVTYYAAFIIVKGIMRGLRNDGSNSESFRLAPWAGRRRRDLLELPDRWIETITELSQGDRAAESATVGAHHQTGEFEVAPLAGGRRKVTVRSLPEWRSKYPPPDDATRTENGRSSDGSPTGRLSVLDDARDGTIHRGTSSVRTWDSPEIVMARAVERREIDWASRSSSPGSSK